MALKDAVRTAAEIIAPPSPAELQKRLDQARAALLAAEQQDRTAQDAQALAFGGDDDKAAQAAQTGRVQARLALERAAGRALALERQLKAAEAAQAADVLSAGRKALAGLTAQRGEHGARIAAALDGLAVEVAALVEVDEQIAALPVAVRGADAVLGYNFGAGPLRQYLVAELEQRGVVGQPSSTQPVRFADWLAIGSATLGAK